MDNVPTPTDIEAEWRRIHSGHCPELPYGDRLGKRQNDRREQRALEDRCYDAVPAPRAAS